ncbi:MAG TPA: class I SAM-dependent methyltransferase [Bryobacteraceae bacterium]|nr:class I SAM-dependent methyltransferase [Bryobacteraceae bacterium]
MDRPRVDYDRLASVYDSRYSVNRLAGIGEALVALAARMGARRVLEVGCGTGYWLGELASHAPFVCGADISIGMLEHARAKLASAPLVAARANALPFTGASFDLIFVVNAIHHFEDPCAFIRGAADLLAAGGALAVIGIDPRLLCRRYFYDYFEGSWERDLRRFPAIGDIVNWLAAAGFARIEYRIVERYRRIFQGDAVLTDPFLQKTSNSLLGLLTDADYELGLRRIEAAIAAGTTEFISDIAFPMIAGWRQPPAGHGARN